MFKIITKGNQKNYHKVEIKKLIIEGFKSIESIVLNHPNKFSVFVGANASGKSNIFEALEFFEICHSTFAFEAIKTYNSLEDVFNQAKLIPQPKRPNLPQILISVDLGEIAPLLRLLPTYENEKLVLSQYESSDLILHYETNTQHPRKYSNPEREDWGAVLKDSKDYSQWMNFTRLFVDKPQFKKRYTNNDANLSLDASNLEHVLQRILQDEKKKIEILEILQLLIPGFKDLEIITEELSGTSHLLVHEKHVKNPLPKRLISEGTYNIIAMVTAIFQSDKPQFLCIEEPENGLNPKVIREMVNIFREQCEINGHYIWLNTHSETLISELTTDELILVDKNNGSTGVKQLKGFDLQGMSIVEALNTNSLGGGIPW